MAHYRKWKWKWKWNGKWKQEGKERLRMQAIATYPTRATATECLPMEQQR